MSRTIDPNPRQGHLKGSKAPNAHQGVVSHNWRRELRELQGKPVNDTPKQKQPSWNNGRSKKPHYLRRGVIE